MYSLRIREKQIEAELDNSSRRAILWQNLRSKKKSGRMVRRIYNKTREQMAVSCRERCRAWVTAAAADTTNQWIRKPQPSVFQHTCRDRHREDEIGPANGHISGRKYIPRLAFSGGGKLDEEKTADLQETFKIPSQMRGNDPTALQNPCRPTVIITDTAKIRGRIEHPHWEPPRYFLRPREKAKEIGPEMQYADRNDTQRVYAGVVKSSLFSWGQYEGGGPHAIPSFRDENRAKWVCDEEFYPGFKHRDNQRETMAGERFPKDLLNANDYRPPRGFERQRYPEKELPQRDRFRLVVKSGEYACPDGITRRSLRYEEEPPEPYPEGKTYCISLRSMQPPISKQMGLSQNGQFHRSASLGSLPGRDGSGGYCKESGTTRDKSFLERRKGINNSGVGDSSAGEGNTAVSRGQNSGGGANKRFDRASPQLLSSSKSCPSVRFPPESTIIRENADSSMMRENVEPGDRGGNEKRRAEEMFVAKKEAQEAAGQAAERDSIIAGGMRRGSEMASWAVCGTSNNSSRDYLW